MKVSRRGFLSGATAAGLASSTGTASTTQTDIFDTPPILDHRNGMPYRAFGTVPVALERGIAVIAMKTQGGGAIPQKAPVSALDCLHYAMSLNVPVCLSGMTNLDIATENIAFAKNFKPLPMSERNAFLARVKPLAGAGVLEHFKSTQRYDSSYHQKQHGFQ